ncbi:MAG TPA: SH3 domain-containing protein [Clostridia bacterium]|nr:SH3 domain-containing protein [Clostridia bacterium]
MAAVSVPGVPAFASEAEEYYALHEGTAVFSQADFDSDTAAVLERDTIVTVTETKTVNGVVWLKVEAGGVSGYIPSYNLYKKSFDKTYSLRYARITENKSGDEVYLYSSPSAESHKLAKLNDGKRVKLTGVKAGDFLEIEHEGKRGYVLQQAVTEGLTYHQYLALIVGIICFAAIALIFLLTYFSKNKKKPRT